MTWTRWARRTTAPNFKEVSRPILSAIPTPIKVGEGEEYSFASPGDSKEVYRLAKYGSTFAITWEALVNDELNSFYDITAKFGQAARRLEDDLAYVPITGNQVMTEDNVALFHANHNNLVGSGGTPPTVASLGVMRAKMARQKGLKGEILKIQPASLLVPVELQTTAEQLVASLVDPSKNNAAANPDFIRNLDVVGEARLSENSTTAWYLAASNGSVDTVEMCFLEGNEQPYTEERDGFTIDAKEYKLRHVVAARAIDYRGLAKNVGV